MSPVATEKLMQTPVSPEPEISVVIPCLNEEETLALVIERVLTTFRNESIDGELIIADNGSHDQSIEIARSFPEVRLVHVQKRGYGNALAAGIKAARSPYVVMGDADCSYDFAEIPNFLVKLREGFDIVQGCRLPAGGGKVAPGAMPWSHRWIGNPALTLIARTFFQVPVHDVYCGLRAFSKTAYDTLGQRCGGMEFAVEMVVKSALAGKKTTEIPITLHPDRRINNRPHLRTLRDGWRTLRFFLLASPTWLFFIPGATIALAGLLISALPYINPRFEGHTLLAGCLMFLTGYQCMLFAMFAQVVNYNTNLFPISSYVRPIFKHMTLERIIVAGSLVSLTGLFLLARVLLQWIETDFGPLAYSSTLRVFIPGFTLVFAGFLTVVSGFMGSIVGMYGEPETRLSP